MALTLLTGGARSGKSALAARLASAWSGPVSFVATAEALDEEMRERIARHRAGRPSAWATIEEPIDIGGAIASAPPGGLVVVDCLTLWVSNLFERGCGTAEIEERASAASAIASDHNGPVIVVSNEVGSGIVPADPATRTYRDALGTVNVIFAAAARRTFLVVAGRALPLADDGEVLGDVIDG